MSRHDPGMAWIMPDELWIVVERENASAPWLVADDLGPYGDRRDAGEAAEKAQAEARYPGNGAGDPTPAYELKPVRFVRAAVALPEPRLPPMLTRNLPALPDVEAARLRDVIRTGGAAYRAERAALGCPGGIDNNDTLALRDVRRELIALADKVARILGEAPPRGGAVDLPRTPDGHINNCALAAGEPESECQMCGERAQYPGAPKHCPDRATEPR